MGPMPTQWRGTCQNYHKDGIECNSKLLGVRFFNKGYLHYARHVAGRINATYVITPMVMTGRDLDGHGSHTLATDGGNFVTNASFFGYGNEKATGGSPKARVASYKICWKPLDDQGCYDADIMAALEVAISDGVDVLSI
ncbi:hypothetical protein Patl1_05930 [Pistacia atlantica]|uniref:Uncharacterized protein n=1 Tax=Pistacia atlantica TaxID=434234 RepID=A0ACC1BPH7_9ROSI|nr:hypothetical protein Patl1_05930 [Pistacia atlantica]